MNAGRSIWATLGIAATKDRDAIRRAYARRLKTTNPEDDAEGFQVLRAAYDLALKRAARVEDIDEDFEIDDRLIDLIDGLRSSSQAVEQPDLSDLPIKTASVDLTPHAEPELALLKQQEVEHRAAADALLQLVSGASPWARDAEILAAYWALVESPAMEQVRHYRWTEDFLGWLIQTHGGVTDVLVIPVSERFGWDGKRLALNAPGNAVAIARRDQLERLAQMRRAGHPDHAAFLALAVKPKLSSKVLNRLTPGLPAKVRMLLEEFRYGSGGMEHRLDQAAVAWWDSYFAKPRLGALALWIGLFSPIVAMLAFAPGLEVAPIGRWAIFVLVIGGAWVGVAGWSWVVLAARQRWRDAFRYQYPGWRGLGWGLVAAAVIAATAVPDLAGLILPMIAGSLISLVWAFITAAPSDQRAAAARAWPFLFLAAFVYFSSETARTDFWLRGMLAVAFGAAIAVIGGGSLANSFSQAPPRLRQGVCLVLAAMIAATPFLLWDGGEGYDLMPTCASVIILLFAAHLIVTDRLTGPFRALRDLSLRFAWLFWILWNYVSDEVVGQGHAKMFYAGVWLMTSAALGVLGMIWQDRRSVQLALA